MTKLHKTLIRLLIAGLAGMLIFVLAIRVAWQNIQTNFLVLSQRYRTIHLMEDLSQELNRYRERQSEFPQNLLELKQALEAEDETTKAWRWSLIDDEGIIRDAWDHPMVYRIEGDAVLLLSYGRDGVPGGLGLDHDFSNQEPDPPAGKPTFEQFLLELPTDMMIFTCVMAGVFTFLLIFRTMNPDEMQPRQLPGLLLKLALVLFMAWFIAVPMSLLHAPSGH